MRRTKLPLLVLIGVVLSACNTPYLVESWKADNIYRPRFNKVLVVAVVKDSTYGLRKRIEHNLSKELAAYNYSSSSAAEEYGESGFAGLDQEEAFIRLCNSGFDGIITVALIDVNKDNDDHLFGVQRNYSRHYYDRIWNYQYIQADLDDSSGSTGGTYYWEVIFFNIVTLQPQIILRTKTFEGSDSSSLLPDDFENRIIHKLIKTKMLRKRSQ